MELELLLAALDGLGSPADDADSFSQAMDLAWVQLGHCLGSRARISFTHGRLQGELQWVSGGISFWKWIQVGGSACSGPLPSLKVFLSFLQAVSVNKDYLIQSPPMHGPGSPLLLPTSWSLVAGAWSKILCSFQYLVPHDLPPDTQTIGNTKEAGSSSRINPFRFQIYIKSPEGPSLSIWITVTDNVLSRKHSISQKAGYPANLQNLVYGGRALQDFRQLQNYDIQRASTIVLNLRLRGVGVGIVIHPSMAGKVSGSNPLKFPEEKTNQTFRGPLFKHILQGKRSATDTQKKDKKLQEGSATSPYIAELMNSNGITYRRS